MGIVDEDIARVKGATDVVAVIGEVVGLRKDGSIFPLDLAVSEMNVGGRRMFTGIARGASEQARQVQAVSATDGRPLFEFQLNSLPTWDGMAAASGRLYLSTGNGSVHCFGPVAASPGAVPLWCQAPWVATPGRHHLLFRGRPARGPQMRQGSVDVAAGDVALQPGGGRGAVALQVIMQLDQGARGRIIAGEVERHATRF